MDEPTAPHGGAPPPDRSGPALDVDAARSLAVLTRDLANGSTDDRVEDEQLEELARALESTRRALDAVTAKVNGELAARSSTDRRHGHATKSWTASTLHLPSIEAGRRVKAAKLLRQCPTLAEALRTGRIGFDHVRVIANATTPRNIAVVVDVQEQIVGMTTEFLLFSAWAAQVVDLLRLADPDGAEPREEDSRIRVTPQFDGSARLEGTLVGEFRHVVHHAIETFTDRLFQRFWTDHAEAPEDFPVPDRSSLRAAALAEICRTALAATHVGSGTAADVTYVIHSDDPATVWTAAGERVDSHTAHVAVCDGVFHPVVLDRFGVPLDLGRHKRFASRAQRRAAGVRDGGCVFPGCDAGVGHTDLHHVEPWKDASAPRSPLDRHGACSHSADAMPAAAPGTEATATGPGRGATYESALNTEANTDGSTDGNTDGAPDGDTGGRTISPTWRRCVATTTASCTGRVGGCERSSTSGSGSPRRPVPS